MAAFDICAHVTVLSGVHVSASTVFLGDGRWPGAFARGISAMDAPARRLRCGETSMRLRTCPSAGHVAPLRRSNRALASLVLPLLLMWQPLVPPEPARAAGFFEFQLPGARVGEPANTPASALGVGGGVSSDSVGGRGERGQGEARVMGEVLVDLGLMPAQQGAQDKEAGRTSREAKAEAEKRKEVEKKEVEKKAGAEKRMEVEKKKKEADKKMVEKKTDILERVTSPLLPDKGRDACVCLCVHV